MVIYTPIPVELLSSSESHERRFTEIPYGEARVIAETSAEGTCRIVRIISSNPDHYMQPELQPGSEIMLMPIFG